MKFREFGDPELPEIVILHGGGLSRRNDICRFSIFGSGHGEVSLLRPRDYCALLLELFQGNE